MGDEERPTVVTETGEAVLTGFLRAPAGEVVGGYAIEAVAGVGGMGVVYRASDPELGRSVALKLISPERAADPRFRELFVRESLTAASLEHPNVIPIYRAGDDDGRLFIAMRFVDGASLQDLLADGVPLPPGRAARIVARVAGALDAAHAKGLVHRDVKPANVLIADPDGDEQVYLTDFGLSVPATVSGTAPGRWAGTLAYLAPEQIRGEPLDARTDVYALGCVLFHALTGRPPFPTGDREAALEAHLVSPPPSVAGLVAGVPPAMDQVVRRAMAKRPDDRFATAGELAVAALAARFDLAICHHPDDAPAAARIASALREHDLQVVVAGDDRAAAEATLASEACAVLVGPRGLGPWAREALAAASDVGKHDRAFRLVATLLPGGPDPLGPELAFLATQPWADLRGGIAEGIDDLLRAVRGSAPPLLGEPTDVCPYRGLESFDEEHADLFFGREGDVARLLEMLRSGRFVAVVGPSGSGKSSLLRAGLVPAIRRGAVPGGTGWRPLDLAPGPHPLAALAARLAGVPGAGAPSPADLAADERALDAALDRALGGRPADERVLLLVDQLEEAFTLCQDPGERAAFLSNLTYAATIPGGRAVVVVAMRSDYYGRLAEHPEMRAAAAARQFALGPMDARGLRRAIEQPARRAGLELEPGLTRRILTDVADRPGALPLLEHLLLEVWRRRSGRTLTLEAYGASGGVEGALARRANEVYGALSPERQAIARRILLRLTQPGEGAEDTRRRAGMDELVTRPGEEGEVTAVVEALAGARLLTTGRDEGTGGVVVDVTHEALIRGWPELRGWIDEDRERLRLHRRLTDAVAEWEGAGRDEALLYRGRRIAAWEGRDESDLNDGERAFLAASRERAGREAATRRRRVRLAIGGLAVALAIITGVAVFAFLQRGEANDQRDVARSRQLAASARLQLPTDPELSLLLAREAHAVEPTPEAEEILRQATYESQVRGAIRADDGRMNGLAYSPDGRTVAAVGDDGNLRLWRPADGTATTIATGAGELRGVAFAPGGAAVATAGADGTVRLWSASGEPDRVLRGHEGGVNAVAFSPDGRLLASAGDDGTVRVWTRSTGTARVIRAHEGVGWVVAFSPDGARLASGGDDMLVRVWRPDGAPVAALRGHEGQVYDVAFSPDGRGLVSGAGDATVRVWDLDRAGARPRVIRATRIFGSAAVSFSGDGREILSAGLDGTVRVWRADGTPLAVLRGHENRVYDAAFSPDGRWVATAGEDGTARVWDWAARRPDAEVALVEVGLYSGGAELVGDGSSLLSLGLTGSISSWDLRAPRVTPIVPPKPSDDDYFNTGEASRDGTRVAFSRPEGPIVVREVAGGAPIVLRGHRGEVWGLDFSDDGRVLASAGGDGTVRLWDLSTRTGAVMRGHADVVNAVDLSADGTLLVSAGDDGSVRVWDTASRRQIRLLEGHEGAVLDAGISPDGARVVSGGSDRTVRLWDRSGGPATVLSGHQNTVYTARFSPDGTRLLSVADDGVRVWDAATGTTVLQIDAPARDVFRAQMSEDGSRIAVTTFSDRIRVYGCETCGTLDEVRSLAASRVTRDLTPDERDEFSVPDG